MSPGNSPTLSTQKALQPFDACSFEIALPEILAGKFSVHANGGGEVTHLVRPLCRVYIQAAVVTEPFI